MSSQPAENGHDGYDIFSPGFRTDPYATWSAMRASGCPVAHSGQWGGSWMPVRYDTIREIARDGERFSSRAVEVAGPLESAGGLFLPPLTSDPPQHKLHRDVLMPYFLPKRIAAFEPFIRDKARDLATALAARGGGDVVTDFAQELTIAVLTTMLGVPPGEQFTDWMIRMIRIGPRDQAVRAQAVGEILAYLGGLLDEREAEPRDDLITYLAGAAIDGVPLSRKHQIGSAFLILIAGADTTWSAIGSSLWHLAVHDHDRRRLARDPALIPVAVEEFLRAYAPITIGRIAASKAEIAGCPVAPGDRVLLPWGAANRDPAAFEDPDEVLIDRKRNPHLAFGLGIHRCLGSGLARMEIRVALEEWLKRIPEFTLAPAFTPEYETGMIRCMKRLELTF